METLQPLGVAGRCRVVGGSFFDAVPEGGDAYVLQGVLHNWDDERATAIVRSCRRACRPGASLLVLERELGPPNEKREAKLADLNMLIGPGGRERTSQEYETLLAGAGFQWRSITPSVSGIDVIEAAAA